MKNKMIYLLLSFLQVIGALYLFIIRKTYVPSLIQDYKDMALEDLSISIYQSIYEFVSKYGEVLFISILVITILLNFFLIYKHLKKEEVNYKLIIIISLICTLINESILLMFLSLTNLVVAIIQKANVQRCQKEKDEKKDISIPKLDSHQVTLKGRLLAILCILIYLFLPYIIGYLPFGYITLNIILDILMIGICLLIFRKELLRDGKKLFENFRSYTKYVTNKYFLALGIYFLISALTMLIKGDAAVSENQQTIQMLPMLFVIPSAVIYAPFVEELVFRGAIRRLIKSDRLYIIISALSFGIIHTLGEATLFDMLVLSLPYATLGGFFAYIYVKTRNITASMIGHFMHNAIACVMLILY